MQNDIVSLMMVHVQQGILFHVAVAVMVQGGRRNTGNLNFQGLLEYFCALWPC